MIDPKKVIELLLKATIVVVCVWHCLWATDTIAIMGGWRPY